MITRRFAISSAMAAILATMDNKDAVEQADLEEARSDQEKLGKRLDDFGPEHKGKLEAVLAMIDCGDLGGGSGYGCAEHKAALERVVQQVAETYRSIAEMERKDAESTFDAAQGEVK